MLPQNRDLNNYLETFQLRDISQLYLFFLSFLDARGGLLILDLDTFCIMLLMGSVDAKRLRGDAFFAIEKHNTVYALYFIYSLRSKHLINCLIGVLLRR